MKLTEVFLNEYARTEVNLQWKFIRITWLQHTEHETLRNALRIALQIAKEAQLNHWLFDLRKLNYTMLSDQIWTATEFFSSFDLSLDHRLACIVNPLSAEMFPDVAIQESLQQNQELGEQIKLEIFTDMEIAKFWLFD